MGLGFQDVRLVGSLDSGLGIHTYVYMCAHALLLNLYITGHIHTRETCHTEWQAIRVSIQTCENK